MIAADVFVLVEKYVEKKEYAVSSKLKFYFNFIKFMSMSDNQYNFLKDKHNFSDDQIHMIKGFDEIAKQYGSIQNMIEESMKMRRSTILSSNALKVLDAAIMWQMAIRMLKNKHSMESVNPILSKMNALLADL